MLTILTPVDGSNNATRVVEQVVDLAKQSRQAEVCLINVREAMDSPEVHRFWSPEKIAAFQNTEGNLLLASARQRLEQAGVRYTAAVVIGDVAPTIAAQAKARGCNLIVMGTRGMGSIGNLLMGSVATKVVHLAEVPVMLVR